MHGSGRVRSDIIHCVMLMDSCIYWKSHDCTTPSSGTEPRS